jgi:hypothetical protein
MFKHAALMYGIPKNYNKKVNLMNKVHFVLSCHDSLHLLQIGKHLQQLGIIIEPHVLQVT